MEKKHCISCKTDISNVLGSVIFMCPGCNKVEIVRCGRCRKLTSEYKCPGCGFEGP